MKEHFLGSHTFEDWAFASFLSLLGFIFLKFLKFRKNKNTGTFDIKYWINDNIKEAVLGFILFYVSFRFYEYIKVEFNQRIWETDLMNDKFLFAVVVSVASCTILEKLRTTLSLSPAATQKGVDEEETAS